MRMDAPGQIHVDAFSNRLRTGKQWFDNISAGTSSEQSPL
jgi:hypothetical protein